MAAIGFVFAPSFVSKNSNLQIKSIAVNGNSVVQTEEITNLVLREITGNFLHLYSKSNIFLYPQKTIERKLLEKFSRFNNAEVEITDFNDLSVFVTEREPFALWCQSQDALACYFVDDDGYIFDKAPDFSPNVYFTYFGEIQSSDSPVGSFMLNQNEFSNSEAVIEGLKVLGFNPTGLKFTKKDGTVVLSNSTDIIFRLSDDASRTLSNFESVINDPSLDLRNGNTLKARYFDLRFGNKVFYKKTE